MSRSAQVRFSRDGDQFHYLWAARRCLRLLAPHTDLVAVTIEGVSALEAAESAPVEAGGAVIDVAEYYGLSGDMENWTRGDMKNWAPSD
jgi:hypothetical protein